MPDPVIVDCLRTPVGKANRGALRNTRPDDLAATAIRGLLERHPEVPRDDIEDVILGCAMPEAEAGFNIARMAALRAGLPVTTTGVTINRFCSSGLQSIAMACDRISAGGAHILIAGGAESMSMIPMMGHKVAPNPWFVDHYPQVYINMGLTAEQVQRRYGISREDADAHAWCSHQNALNAQAEGRFNDEIVSVKVETAAVNGEGKPVRTETTFDKDEGPRADTSIEALAKLKPVFQASGTVTAGNSSQTSDGAATALVMSEKKARECGLKPRARLVSFATAGVPPEIMGIGPVVAIPKALALAGLKLDDIGVIELNEAFAVQALAVMRLAELNPAIVNVNGGAIALGHPLGCTGAKLTATILREMERRNVRYGMVTMCVGGGQGAAGIFERI
ncbi:MAG TPA: acetyl-CoA C-acyltransferase [Bryobacteraceae bacterium]|jgi:acetyl-CoA acyltransferase|nr:acetyl-CoA C-acyltransferase [Bryobacteraceae bacterium]